MKNEALNAFSSLRFHLEENGAKYFQLSSLMRFQKYLFSVSSDDVNVFTSMRFHPRAPGFHPRQKRCDAFSKGSTFETGFEILRFHQSFRAFQCG